MPVYRSATLLTPSPSALSTVKGWHLITSVVLALGLLLRVVVWGQQRSIVLDESNLIRNYVERSYAQLFHPLNYEQYAPPLFSVAVKACIYAFGNNELSVRLFPLLCSLATLILFRRLVQRQLPAGVACMALGFVAFGYLFVDYATECKQYATDGFVALGLLEVGYHVTKRRLTGPLAFGLAGIGMVSVWLSMPAVFVLAGIGLWWLVRSVRTQDWRTTRHVTGIGAAWAASFLVYFFCLLKPSAGLSNLQTFHREYFLAFPPTSRADFELLIHQFERLADRAIGKTILAMAFASCGFGLGVWAAVRRREESFWCFLFPIVACLAASALHYYSLIPRLTLFFLPLVVVLIFQGWALVATRRITYWIVLGVAGIVLGNQQRLGHLFTPFYSDYAEVKTGLDYIALHQRPDEKVLLNYEVAPIGRYYFQYRQPSFRLLGVVLQSVSTDSTTDFAHSMLISLSQLRQQGVNRVWLLYDREDDSFKTLVASQGRILTRYDFQRGYVLLLQLN